MIFSQEPGALPFIPNIRSQFQHVFIIVRAHNPCSDNTQYRYGANIFSREKIFFFRISQQIFLVHLHFDFLSICSFYQHRFEKVHHITIKQLHGLSGPS